MIAGVMTITKLVSRRNQVAEPLETNKDLKRSEVETHVDPMADVAPTVDPNDAVSVKPTTTEGRAVATFPQAVTDEAAATVVSEKNENVLAGENGATALEFESVEVELPYERSPPESPSAGCHEESETVQGATGVVEARGTPRSPPVSARNDEAESHQVVAETASVQSSFDGADADDFVDADTRAPVAAWNAVEEGEDITVVHVEATAAVAASVSSEHASSLATPTRQIPPASTSSPLRDAPALRPVSSMKLFDTVDSLDNVRGDILNLSLTSLDAPAVRNSQSDEKRRNKLIQFDALVRRIVVCMERERMRLVDLVLEHVSHDGSDASLASFEASSGLSVTAWLQSVRVFESSVNTMSLGRLLGPQKSGKICSCFMEELLDDGDAFLETLSPFTCYLLAKEVVRRIGAGLDEEHAVRYSSFSRRLVFAALRAVHGSTIEGVGVVEPSHNQTRISQVALVSFPVDLHVPFYAATLWTLAGEIIESQSNDVEAIADVPMVLPLCITAALTLLGMDSTHVESPYQVTYLMALALSSGNYGPAWSSLSLSLDPADVVHIHGVGVPAVQTLGEAARCMSGVSCSQFSFWTEAAQVLECFEAKLRRDAKQRGESSTEAVQFHVATAAHEAFLCRDKSRTLAFGRRECLARAASLPEASSNASLWLSLGDVLHMETTVETIDGKGDVLTVDEETVDVGESSMRVTRMDCYQLALAIETSSAAAWYRAAMSMEDLVVLKAKAAKNGIRAIDERLYSRPLMGHTQGPVDRMTALMYAVTMDPDDARYWFALATSLAERSLVVTNTFDGETICIPNKLLSQSQQQGSANTFNMANVNADDLFQQCIRIRPQMQSVVQTWKERRQTH